MEKILASTRNRIVSAGCDAAARTLGRSLVIVGGAAALWTPVV